MKKPWLEISKQGLQLEGLCFDRQGNLLLCEVFGGTIFHVNLPDKKVTELFKSISSQGLGSDCR
jgi:lactonase